MIEATLDEDGNIRIPAEVVSRLHLQRGQHLTVSVPGSNVADTTVEVVLREETEPGPLARPLPRLDRQEAQSILNDRSAWAEREDITDSLEFVRDLRAGLDPL